MPVQNVPAGTKKFTFHMPVELHRRLKIAAATYSSEMTIILVRAVRKHLDRLEKVKGK